MERFVIIVNAWERLTIITKRSILDTGLETREQQRTTINHDREREGDGLFDEWKNKSE